MPNKNYYEILGVEKNASREEINKAYKKLCMKWHPDRWINATEEEKKNAEDKFKEINEANSILSDQEKRSHYDMFGSPESDSFNPFGGGFSPFGFNPFGDFFGGHQSSTYAPKGDDIQIEADISIEQSFNGGKIPVTFTKLNRCKNCNGSGSEDGIAETCQYCQGTGRFRDIKQFGNVQAITERPCPHCNGAGKNITHKCKHCGGSGLVSEITTIEADIPEGVFDNATIVLKGKGHDSADVNGYNGDLYVKIHIKDNKIYTRENDDLIVCLDVNLLEGLCGCTKEVHSPDNKAYTVTVPKLSKQNSQVAYFERKGFSNPKTKQKGNMIVRLNYQFPQTITKEQEQLLKDFYKIENEKNNL